MTRALFALLVLSSAAWAADNAVTIDQAVSVRALEPRAYGYFVGDTIHRVIEVTADRPYQLDVASRPAPGRLNYWLDLRATDVTETSAGDARQYRLSLDYQTFYVPLSPAKLTLPGMKLRFSKEGGAIEADIPAFSFVMSPLREVQPEAPENGPAGYLQPDRVPRTVSASASRTGFAAGALCALLGLVLLAYSRAWWPFRARPHRPFTRAARALRAYLRRGEDAASYRAGLIELHRAFDSSAGRRLLADDLPDFLSEHREFRPLEDEIAKFFAVSRQAFFVGDLQGAERAMPIHAVSNLSTRLGDAERRAA